MKKLLIVLFVFSLMGCDVASNNIDTGGNSVDTVEPIEQIDPKLYGTWQSNSNDNDNDVTIVFNIDGTMLYTYTVLVLKTYETYEPEAITEMYTFVYDFENYIRILVGNDPQQYQYRFDYKEGLWDVLYLYSPPNPSYKFSDKYFRVK